MIVSPSDFEPLLKDHELKAMRKSGKIAATILWDLINSMKPGMTTGNLDALAGKLFKLHKSHSAPRLEGFPGNACISVNEIIAHGIPGKRVLQSGDRVNIDVSVEHGGYFSDVAYTLILGENGHLSNPLLDCARQITMDAIGSSVAGTPINEVAKQIEDSARSKQYSIIKNLCSHGVGKSLHTYPVNILNYYDSDETIVLCEGMIIAWEPFVSAGACRAIESDGEWNLTTHNKSEVAQFEHTILITSQGSEILTQV